MLTGDHDTVHHSDKLAASEDFTAGDSATISLNEASTSKTMLPTGATKFNKLIVLLNRISSPKKKKVGRADVLAIKEVTKILKRPSKCQC